MYYRSPCLFFRNTVRSASSCFRVRQDHYGARGLWPDHPCARGLARPLRALGPSGTRQTTPCSGTSGQTTPCSGTASITLQPRLGDFVARSSTCAQGLLDHSPTMARRLCVSTTCDWQLAYSWDIFSPLDLATRLIPHLPASSGTTLV